MKKISLLFIALIPAFTFCQMSNVTVYDEYGNDLGTYTVQSNYAEQNSNNLRMAVRDYINYLESKEDREAKAKAREELNKRAAKFGMSVPSYSGSAAMEGYLSVRESQAYSEEQSKLRAEEQARRVATINKAIESDIMNAYDYAKNITLSYKKELGIKKGSGYHKLPTILFESQGKGKYVRQEGNIQMMYYFTWPGERNIDFANRYKQYEKYSGKKMKSGESWGQINISRKTIYRNTGIVATVEYEDEYDIGIRAYYGAEDSNGIDYAVMIESRANKKEASKEDVRRVFDFYKPLLEKCIANSRVTVKKLMNETIVLDTEKTKKESKSSSISNSSKKKSSNKEIEVRKLTNTALEKYNNGDLDGAIEDSNKAISIDKSILRSERTTDSPDQTYANRGFYLAKKGELDKSIEDYNTAIDINPENVYAYHYRGTIKKFKKDNYGAISDFSKAFQLNKEVDKYQSNLISSNLKLELGDINGAIIGFNESIASHPEIAYLALYRIYKDLERFEESKEMASKILLLPPNESQLYVLYDNATPYFNDKKNASKVISIAEQMIRIRKDLSLDETETEYNILGWGKRETGDYYGAISAYTKALEINPQSPNNRGGMGTAKFYLGDISGACSDWNTAIKMENISEDSKEHYQKFINENCNK